MNTSKSPVNAPFDYELLAALILEKREKDNLTLKAMSEQAGVPLTTCYDAEAVGKKMGIATIVSLCNWLELPVQTFLTPKQSKYVKAKKEKAAKGRAVSNNG